MSQWTAAVAGIAWALANGLDILSMLAAIQNGERLATAALHPAESWLFYAGLRILATLALYLLTVRVSRRRQSLFGVAWTSLTVCSLVTAVIAWWRLGLRL